MCLLIVLCGIDPEYPILVASNRDEERTRKAAPPGLFVGARRRLLSPRDRRAGGTWLAVGVQGMLAGLTNLAGAGPRRPGAPSRGHLPHLALEHDDVDAALAAICAELDRAEVRRVGGYGPFQLAVSDGRRTAVLVAPGGGRPPKVSVPDGPVAVLTNEHRLGELVLPAIERALIADLDGAARLDALAPLLLDQGGPGRHRILKKGETYGTVSSSLIAVHRDDPRRLIWRYAPGPPDETRYRDYGNLGRRLLDSE